VPFLKAGEERKRVGRREMEKISDRRRKNINDIQT
jgi:hypothetical protein